MLDIFSHIFWPQLRMTIAKDVYVAITASMDWSSILECSYWAQVCPHLCSDNLCNSEFSGFEHLDNILETVSKLIFDDK